VTLAPLIVTAVLGTADQRRFDALRRAHFPPERNYLSAHLTLFHHLPPARADELVRLLKDIAADPPPAARVTEVYSLGRGVAYRIESPGLVAMRERVADWFAPDLTAQDQATPRLHITVQNKVEPDVAKALLAELRADFQPHPIAISGFGVYYYRGGPWEMLKEIAFRGKPSGRY
jgi:2'-5' RNA ligase superfamily